ncbi:MAG: hypothetical protein AAB345_00400 [Patescibacteria group bacterium]
MTRERVTDEQYGKLCRKLEELKHRVDITTLPFTRTLDAIQRVIEGKFGDEIPKAIPAYDTDAQLRLWRKFYKKFFGLSVDMSQMVFEACPAGFGWLIVLAKGLTNEQIYAKCKDHFPCGESSFNLNSVISCRVNIKTYAVWVRDGLEPDEELMGQSAEDLSGRINCITLPERLILELCYWSKTKKHLDLGDLTLCAGSRLVSGRDVPFVGWQEGKLRVDDHSCILRCGASLRGRAVVA